MSGPLSTADATAVAADDADVPAPPCVEITESHSAQVGHLLVRRALPRRGRRTVGAWCFADHLGPAQVTPESGLDVGPHPHIGLQTVTWLVDGQVLHRDSLGSEQLISPGQLNLMTAGEGVAHAEEATGHYRGTLQGIQFWVALPEQTRHGGAAFEHHAELPQVGLDGVDATVLMGEFAGERSPARCDSALVGLQLDLFAPAAVPVCPDWEYAVVVLEGAVGLDGVPLPPGKLGYLGRGRDEIRLDVRERTRAMLIGGEPFGEEIVMWWNFVGRSRAEIDQAFVAWERQDDRFGRVDSRLARIPAAPPFWQRSPR